jgi:hypothetical protein
VSNVRAVQRVLLDAALACATSARDTNSSNVAEQCARAARDLAAAHQLLRPNPRHIDTEET